MYQSTVKHIDWSNITTVDKQRYTAQSDVSLSNVRLNHSLILCDDTTCSNPVHQTAIDNMYSYITQALIDASSDIYKSTQSTFKQIAGWNEVCANLHSEARDAFLL